VSDLATRIRALLEQGTHPIPLPGGGATAERHEALCAWGCEDLSFARLAEAHTDALAILAEAGKVPTQGVLYGVWASDGPNSLVSAARIESGWCLHGTKQYCSGAPQAGMTLVTAHFDDAVWLFEVELDRPGIHIEPSTWATPAMDDTETVPVRFDDVIVDQDSALGGADWYLDRPGFWHGAIGPAACWAGGALSLVRAARKLNRRDAHAKAHQGAMEAAAWNLGGILACAAAEIDADPADLNARAEPRALMVRHLIEQACMDILQRFGRATGPQLLAFDAHVARQYAALLLYMRQSHAERDLEKIVTSRSDADQRPAMLTQPTVRMERETADSQRIWMTPMA
jgi:alkylation response protein AidB-like acyl-CoA dehydrogenase